MSIFVKQYATQCDFLTKESWVILSPIEKQIKDKIERIGTPLKNWDISINYGIKTGFNEAFIIDGKKRKELIDQDPKSEEIIRPILRGRDIKRYKYEFSDLYIITTFPSLKIDIEMYPAVKKHLLSFTMERLEQTGNEYTINGEKIKSRKKTSNKWFETQDSISYWEDFSKQKIIWKRIGSILKFSYDKGDIMALDSTCFATGKNIKSLLAIFNSKMGKYLMKDSPKTGTGDLLISVQAIEPLKIPIINPKVEKLIESIVNIILDDMTQNSNLMELENQLNKFIYSIYELNYEEIDFIESEYNQ